MFPTMRDAFAHGRCNRMDLCAPLVNTVQDSVAAYLPPAVWASVALRAELAPSGAVVRGLGRAHYEPVWRRLPRMPPAPHLRSGVTVCAAGFYRVDSTLLPLHCISWIWISCRHLITFPTTVVMYVGRGLLPAGILLHALFCLRVYQASTTPKPEFVAHRGPSLSWWALPVTRSHLDHLPGQHRPHLSRLRCHRQVAPHACHAMLPRLPHIRISVSTPYYKTFTWNLRHGW